MEANAGIQDLLTSDEVALTTTSKTKKTDQIPLIWSASILLNGPPNATEKAARKSHSGDILGTTVIDYRIFGLLRYV